MDFSIISIVIVYLLFAGIVIIRLLFFTTMKLKAVVIITNVMLRLDRGIYLYLPVCVADPPINKPAIHGEFVVLVR